MAEPVASLDALHGLRAPPAPESIAPYVVMILAGFLVAALVLAAARVLLARRQRVARAALAELARSRALPPPERLAAQAKLLRRLARVLGPGAAARQRDAAWLSWLDGLFATSFFSTGEGRVFGSELYSPRANPDIESIDRTLAGLIARLRPRRVRP
ncbi:MAG: DUF4381 family protein [Beijerinckiaceae bacterium]|nr:DUF4381 family protein [Beijerinckiaceae bacterium]